MWCSNFPTVIVNFNPLTQKIRLFRCRAKQIDEGICKTYSIEEWNSISDMSQEIKKFSKWPESFPKEIIPCCPIYGKETECSCLETPITKVLVSFDVHCNAKCRWCGARHDRNSAYEQNTINLQKELYFQTLEKLKGLKLEMIGLTENGEPFFFTKETCDFLKSLTVNDTKEVQIITNGTLLNDEFFNLLMTTDVKYQICISLNSWDRESYKDICGIDAFDKVVNNLRKLYSIKEQRDLHDIVVSFSFDTIECAKKCKNFGDALKQVFPKFIFYFHPTFGNNSQSENEAKDWWEKNSNFSYF